MMKRKANELESRIDDLIKKEETLSEEEMNTIADSIEKLENDSHIKTKWHRLKARHNHSYEDYLKIPDSELNSEELMQMAHLVEPSAHFNAPELFSRAAFELMNLSKEKKRSEHSEQMSQMFWRKWAKKAWEVPFEIGKINIGDLSTPYQLSYHAEMPSLFTQGKIAGQIEALEEYGEYQNLETKYCPETLKSREMINQNDMMQHDIKEMINDIRHGNSLSTDSQKNKHLWKIIKAIHLFQGFKPAPRSNDPLELFQAHFTNISCTTPNEMPMQSYTHSLPPKAGTVLMQPYSPQFYTESSYPENLLTYENFNYQEWADERQYTTFYRSNPSNQHLLQYKNHINDADTVDVEAMYQCGLALENEGRESSAMDFYKKAITHEHERSLINFTKFAIKYDKESYNEVYNSIIQQWNVNSLLNVAKQFAGDLSLHNAAEQIYSNLLTSNTLTSQNNPILQALDNYYQANSKTLKNDPSKKEFLNKLAYYIFENTIKNGVDKTKGMSYFFLNPESFFQRFVDDLINEHINKQDPSFLQEANQLLIDLINESSFHAHLQSGNNNKVTLNRWLTYYYMFNDNFLQAYHHFINIPGNQLKINNDCSKLAAILKKQSNSTAQELGRILEENKEMISRVKPAMNSQENQNTEKQFSRLMTLRKTYAPELFSQLEIWMRQEKQMTPIEDQISEEAPNSSLGFRK